ncbi:MAG: FixH family protein [Bacteroidales bacterium]|nr:FixH family protein [Bacteroidales bacterium]
MKIGWGTGTFIFFAGFVLFMLALVFFASRQRVQLVAENYYEKELKFQDEREKQARTAALSEPLRWELREGMLLLDFPDQVGTPIMGTLFFYNPSNEDLDQKMDFESTNDSLLLDITALPVSRYTLKVDWQAGGVKYYSEGMLIKP